MSTYRYVVFPQGKQPTVEEVRQLKEFAGALANQFAWGTCRRDGRLAVAFDQRSYDHVCAIDPGFEALIGHWKARGCEFLDHLAFVKDAAALRPISAPPLHAHDGRQSLVTLRHEEHLAAKQQAAKEALGHSLLAVEQTLERYAAWERFGVLAPYLMMAVAIAAIIVAGLYIRERLQSPTRENRQESIERLLDSAPGDSEQIDADGATP